MTDIVGGPPTWVIEVPGPVSEDQIEVWRRAFAEGNRNGPLVLADGARVRLIGDTTNHGVLSEPLEAQRDPGPLLLSCAAFVFGAASLIVAVLT